MQTDSRIDNTASSNDLHTSKDIALIALSLAFGIAILALIISVVRRQKVQRQLAISEERLRLAVQNVPVMLYAYDEDGVTLVWNREAERISGYSADEIVGNPKALELVYPDPEIRQSLLDLRREKQGRVQNWEVPFTCKDGTVKIIAMTNNSAQYPLPGWASWGIGVDATEHRKAEQQLELSQQHYYRLVTLAREGILTADEHEIITFANPAFCHVLGYAESEVIGKSILEFVDSQHHAVFARETEQRRQHETSVYEVSLYTRSGERRDFLLSASPLLDREGNYEGALGVFTEITQLKLIQEALHKSEADHRNLVGSLPVGVVVTSAGRIVICNTAGIELLGAQNMRQLQGRLFDEFVAESDLATWRDWCKRFQREIQGIEPVEVMLTTPSGALIATEVRASRSSDDGQPGMQLLLTDIRERKQLQARIIQQQKEESIVTLAGGIAHDFNNILLGIIGATNLLSQSSRLSAEDQELCEVISTSAERMAELTKNLLAFARGDQVHPRKIETKQVISNALLISKATLPPRVVPEVEIAPGIWPVVADPARLEQVLMNLIINAGEAMAESGGTLRITANNNYKENGWTCLQHGYHSAGQYIKVTVEDTGLGMDEETQRRIFDPFFSTKFPGRGLGLAVANGIVRSHNGCLNVSSESGKGSIFTMLLPRAED